MVDSSAQQSAGSASPHLLLYDGVCGFCSRLLQFVLRHDRHQLFSFASLQSAVGRSIVERSGGNPADLKTFYVVAGYRTADRRVLVRSDAALFVAGALGWPWRLAQLTRVAPAVVRDRVYDVVAHSRYRLFGRYDRCLVPSPEFRHRFIDA